jgi:hypothetical protein
MTSAVGPAPAPGPVPAMGAAPAQAAHVARAGQAAIAAAAPAAEAAPVRVPLGLDVDLVKYQGQLSDWVHCVAAATPEAKAKIEEISARINEIKDAMQKADQSAVPRPSALGNLLDLHA